MQPDTSMSKEEYTRSNYLNCHNFLALFLTESEVGQIIKSGLLIIRQNKCNYTLLSSNIREIQILGYLSQNQNVAGMFISLNVNFRK